MESMMLAEKKMQAADSCAEVQRLGAEVTKLQSLLQDREKQVRDLSLIIIFINFINLLILN